MYCQEEGYRERARVEKWNEDEDRELKRERESERKKRRNIMKEKSKGLNGKRKNERDKVM